MSEKVDWLLPANRFRATPMDLLRQGLESGSWEAVSAAFLAITGEKILPQTPSVSIRVDTEDFVKELEPKNVGSLPKVTDVVVTPPRKKKRRPEPEPEPDLDIEDEVEDDEDSPKARKGKIKTRASKVSTKARTNKFVDDMSLAPEDVKYMPTAETLAKLPPSQSRPAYRKVKVKCSVCGLVEKVDPILAPVSLGENHRSKHRCNECSTTGGRV